MSVELVIRSALTSTVGAIAREIYPILRDSVEKSKSGEEIDKPLRLTVGGREVHIRHPEEVPQHLVDSLRTFVESEQDASPVVLSRRAIANGGPEDLRDGKVESNVSAKVGAALLAISADTVFHDARKRIDLVFKLNLGIAILLATILLGAIVGAFICAVLLGKAVWGLAFGALSVGDVVGAFALKPLTATNSAIIATQRLEAIHLRLSEQLKLCGEHATLEDRIRCQTGVWRAIQDDLAMLKGV